jgi:hypothetical protein
MYVYVVAFDICIGFTYDIKGGIKTGVHETRVLRRIFGPKRDEVAGKWRKLHN